MRRVHRFALLSILLVAGSVLAGCEDFDMDKFDVFHLSDKKKLPGERKELFPGGVPGVTQGVPPEYLKGNQPAPETANADESLPPAAKVNPGDEDAAAALKPKAETAAIEPEAAKPKPKRKPKPKTAAVQRAPAQVTIQPAGQGQPAAAAQQQSPWPANPPPQQPQQAQSPWPAPNQANSSPWPAAPQPGTFSR
jgi:hypothetical protein